MYAIGIDIGTTTICAIVLDCDNAVAVKSLTVPNGTYIKGKEFESIQNPQAILDKILILVDDLCQAYAPVKVIGLSCQMHGIVYVDRSGNAAGPLYTWQDGRGDLKAPSSMSYVEELKNRTGSDSLATGFGAVTHYYNTLNRLVPKGAVGFCTIGDFIGMRLTGMCECKTHASNAAGIALYDLGAGRFDSEMIKKADMDPEFFPKVETGCALLGETATGTPVSYCIGDNQASYLGAVSEPEKMILINVGTGGQISVLSADKSAHPQIEPRPLENGVYLRVGSILCGGRAFAALESFFSDVLKMAGVSKPDSLYCAIDNMLENGEIQPGDSLSVSTQFCGTRQNPDLRGRISNLGLNNFTPLHLASGIAEGIAGEYMELYKLMGSDTRHSLLVGSGNGLRKNIYLQKTLSKRFNMPLLIPAHEEEAAFGSALYALTACGYYKKLTEAQKIIKYN